MMPQPGKGRGADEDPRDGAPLSGHGERLMAMGQMMAGFAHEFRNPLAALQSILEGLVADSGVDDPRHDDLVRMQRILRRMNDLVRSSLRFGQPSSPRPGRHEPLALVRAAIELLGPRLAGRPSGTGEASGTSEADEGNATIAIAAPQPLPDLVVDDGQVVQALVILLDNALDATQDPRKVRIVVTPLSNGARLEVMDAGPGIAPEHAGSVFAPFFTTKQRGTGLGLSIARKLVNENRGRLTFESEPGRTTFSMELPGERA